MYLAIFEIFIVLALILAAFLAGGPRRIEESQNRGEPKIERRASRFPRTLSSSFFHRI